MVLAAPGSLTAQASPDANDVLNIPQDITIFGQDDPNNRKATAIVNGHVITGTDVDQRLALVISASRNEISAEEMQRLRMQVLRNLIDETLQIQEAKAPEIEISRDEIEQTYARVASQEFGSDMAAMAKVPTESAEGRERGGWYG